MIDRRGILIGGAALAVIAPFGASASEPLQSARKEFGGAMTAIERRSSGRLGVAVLDYSGAVLGAYRAGERFPMCSIFKMLASAAMLDRVDRGRERLARRIRFGADDVVANSPVTQSRAGGDGMTVAELCEAAITMSDNTAGNLLLACIGGPRGLTLFARSIGDRITRLDRTEPTLNEASPGDPRDTTSPGSMAADLHALAFTNRLSSSSREQMIAWLAGNKTGDRRLRARLPQGWRVADKTGSGERGTTNDVGIMWPPGADPLVVSVYLTGASSEPGERDAIVAEVGAAIAAIHGRGRR